MSSDRAGGRADAIPEVADQRAYVSKSLGDWLVAEGFASRDANSVTYYIRAAPPLFLRAAQPEAGSEEAERLPCRRCRGKGYVRRADSEAVRCPECRVAHPEADRAPEDGFDIDWIDPRTCPHLEVRGGFCRRCGLVLDDVADRASEDER